MKELCSARFIHDRLAYLDLNALLWISEGRDETGKTEKMLTNLEIPKSENGHEWLSWFPLMDHF